MREEKRKRKSDDFKQLRGCEATEMLEALIWPRLRGLLG
jgi:hypothetical protein